ncbi:MAG TPA: GAP family protein [Nakamurella sp.]
MFTVVGSIGVAAPAVVTVVLGDRADEVLTAVDRWMTRQSTVIVAAVLLVLGVLLMVNGFVGL